MVFVIRCEGVVAGVEVNLGGEEAVDGECQRVFPVGLETVVVGESEET